MESCRVYTVGDNEMTVTSALIEGYTHSKIELKQKEKRYGGFFFEAHAIVGVRRINRRRENERDVGDYVSAIDDVPV